MASNATTRPGLWRARKAKAPNHGESTRLNNVSAFARGSRKGKGPTSGLSQARIIAITWLASSVAAFSSICGR
jgi:hypothetical protein